MGAVKAAYLAAFDTTPPPSTVSAIGDGLEAMVRALLPPKTIMASEVDAADIANTAKFDGTGLGVGDYAGWAICNGNNGTRSLGKFLRATTAGIGAGGGSDSNAHTHPLSNAGGAQIRGSATNIYWGALGPSFSSTDRGILTANAGTQNVLSTALVGNTDGASATDNKPAYDDIVYLMKV